MTKKTSDGIIARIITIICLVALTIVIVTGIYFIYSETNRNKNPESNSLSAENNAEDTGKSDIEASSQESTSEAPSDSQTVSDSVVQRSWEDIDGIISQMTLHEKICQMFIVTPEGLTGYETVTASGDATKSALEEYPVSGLVYFAQNLETPEQTREMISNTMQYADELSCMPLFYSVDEEGGFVARCADNLGTTPFSPMYNYREQGTSVAYSNAYSIAQDISKLGFNLDFAPVADTWSNKDNTVIGTRAYSDDFAETAELVSYAVKGFSEGGVYCTLKHFPGHGDTAEDSHYGTAYSSKTAQELAEGEYLAFKSGIEAGADLIMSGHITVPDIDSLPSSVSYAVITGELREKLGYNGVIITDSLAMGAVADMYEPGELAVMAVKAGNDILLMPADLEAAVTGLEEAVRNGDITEERINESVKRILELKSERLELN